MSDDIKDKQYKTGTTTVCVICKDGVILAADKRVTAGYFITNKGYQKIIQLADNLAVTVAGTVSDVQLLSKYLKAELRLKLIRSGKQTTVKEAANLLGAFVYSNIRKFSTIPGVCHFILGGTDHTGFHAYDLSPDGSIIPVEDYTSSGSGSVYAVGVLETLYEPSLSTSDGAKLAAKAINAAVQRDIASGNGIDILTISKDGIEHSRSELLKYKIEA